MHITCLPCLNTIGSNSSAQEIHCRIQVSLLTLALYLQLFASQALLWRSLCFSQSFSPSQRLYSVRFCGEFIIILFNFKVWWTCSAFRSQQILINLVLYRQKYALFSIAYDSEIKKKVFLVITFLLILNLIHNIQRTVWIMNCEASIRILARTHNPVVAPSVLVLHQCCFAGSMDDLQAQVLRVTQLPALLWAVPDVQGLEIGKGIVHMCPW